jgi:hypothetical protein
MPNMDWTKPYEPDAIVVVEEEAHQQQLNAQIRAFRDARSAEAHEANRRLRDELIAEVAKRIRDTCPALTVAKVPMVELYPAAGLMKPSIHGWKMRGYNLLPSGAICYGTRKRLVKMTPEEFGAFLLPNEIRGSRGDERTYENLIGKSPEWYKSWARGEIDKFSKELVTFLMERGAL